MAKRLKLTDQQLQEMVELVKGSDTCSASFKATGEQLTKTKTVLEFFAAPDPG